MNTAHILLVEDDTNLAFVIKDNLELAGFTITHCASGEKAVECIDSQSFDLFVLDVMLPRVDGFTLAKRIREQNSQVPILFLTAKSLKEDRLQGFALGADDYLTKPFSIEELICRIKVFLKRAHVKPSEDDAVRKIGTYWLDLKKLELKHTSGTRKLTRKEADILCCLIDSPNQVLPRETILMKVWGDDDYFLGRSLDVFISRLRKYLSEDASLEIINHHGIGFRLSC
ncbi:response regulator transcription factor [Cytophagales bacterium LB-30]|uniref:Response regulator transcription factor n=1 Tax=Shiella aurantiaca TaxID=3058365 RepID=A0ABT8F702_9BACT|nr:response regulator transcription factor [Shiella aurantiaca]MDN4166160.1 response regulator transcription factor [Shiella aurantiaca]